MENKVEFRTIKLHELDGKRFNVPGFQRGYRWGHDEAEALILDVIEASDGSESYCLQPLVVQYNEDTQMYDLIDGQQRLTTVFILKQLAKKESEEQRAYAKAKGKRSSASADFEDIDYAISYEIRENSEDFLRNIASCELMFENPDVYYMSHAKKHMDECIGNLGFLSTEIFKKFREKAQFIWYQIDPRANAIEMFQKLNVGKIGLTDAELVKAVLLTKENHIKKSELKHEDFLLPIRLSGKAREWDYIEQSLTNDDFWYFLADDKFKDENPRIAIILDAVAQDLANEPNNELDSSKSPFYIIYSHVKKTSGNDRVDRVKDIWDRISEKHALFLEWFNDDEYFHLIGFLVRANITTVREISKAVNYKRKKDIVAWLKDKIRDWRFFSTGKGNGKISVADIDYDMNKRDLRSFFLLFNVLTIMQTIYNDGKKAKTILRFPFEKYEKQSWDIEHIIPKSKEGVETEAYIDAVCNLTLLDSGTNREYKDAEFKKKRDEIRKKAKSDRFVPACTQNVFFKIYSDLDSDANDMDKWKKSDRNKYQEEIENVVFNNFLNKKVAEVSGNG